MRLIPGLEVRKLESLPEYFFLDYPSILKEAMIEIYVLTNTLVNLVHIEGNEEPKFDPYRLIEVLQYERDLNANILELYIEISELVDPFFIESPNLKNNVGNIVSSELFRIYRRFLDLDLYVNGELPYEFYQEYEQGFLLKRKEKTQTAIS